MIEIKQFARRAPVPIKDAHPARLTPIKFPQDFDMGSASAKHDSEFFGLFDPLPGRMSSPAHFDRQCILFDTLAGFILIGAFPGRLFEFGQFAPQVIGFDKVISDVRRHV